MITLDAFFEDLFRWLIETCEGFSISQSQLERFGIVILFFFQSLRYERASFAGGNKWTEAFNFITVALCVIRHRLPYSWRDSWRAIAKANPVLMLFIYAPFYLAIYQMGLVVFGFADWVIGGQALSFAFTYYLVSLGNDEGGRPFRRYIQDKFQGGMVHAPAQ